MWFQKWSIYFSKAIPRSRAVLDRKFPSPCKKLALLVEDVDSISVLLQTPSVIVHSKSHSKLSWLNSIPLQYCIIKMQLQMRLHGRNALQYSLMQLHERLQKRIWGPAEPSQPDPHVLHQRALLCNMSRSTPWSGKPLACCHNSTRGEIKHKAKFTSAEQE